MKKFKFLFFSLLLMFFNKVSSDVYNNMVVSDRFSNVDFNINQEDKVVNKIIQSKDGYIWLSTSSGIFKYNSREFFDFSKSGVPKNTSCIYENIDSVLWICTNSGLFKIKNNLIEKVEDKNLKELSWISNIIGDDSGNLYISSGNNAYFYDYKKSEYKKLNVDNLNNIYKYLEDVYLLTKTNVLLKFDFYTKKFVRYKNLKDKDDIKYYYIDPITNHHYIFKNNSYDIYDDDFVFLRTINIDLSSYIYKKFNEKLFIFDTIGNAFILRNDNVNKINIGNFGDQIIDFHKDFQGTVWVSTIKDLKTLNKTKRSSRFTKFDSPKSYAENSKFKIVKTKNSLLLFDKKENELLKSLNLKEYSWQIISDNETFYILLDSGVYKINNNLNLEKIYESNSDRFYFNIIDNILYIGGRDTVGFEIYNLKTKEKKSYLNNKNDMFFINGDFITKILKSKNDIWLGTTNGVIHIDEKTEKTSYIYLKDKKSNIFVTDITKSDNYIYASTKHNGVYKLKVKDELITSDLITSLDDLQYSNMYSYKDNIYLFTNDSLYVYNNKSGFSKGFKNIYNDLDLSFYNSRITGRNNLININSKNGILTLDLDLIKDVYYEPDIYIESVKVNNKEYLNSENPSFQHGDRVILKFESLDFIKNERKYRYKLNDKNWVNINSGYIDFHYLDFGKYKITVNTTNNEGHWLETYDTYEFEILKPWYFYVILILAIILISFFAHFIYLRHNQLIGFKKEASTDSLTDLPNRYSLNNKLESLLKNNDNFTIILIDLDDFKRINDTFGYDFGDKVITEISNHLKFLINSKTSVYRINGDEFAIIYNGKDLEQKINYLRESKRQSYIVDESKIVITYSAGIYTNKNNKLSIHEIIKRSYISLYSSKEKGYGNITKFSESMLKGFNENMEIRHLLNEALEKKELELYFQPKVCIKTNRVIGYEALIRWFHFNKGFIRPDLFISQAEKNGTIHDIGNWVIEETCKRASVIHHKGLLKDNISLNISPVQFYKSEKLIDTLKSSIEKYDLPPSKIEVEITESLFINGFERIIDTLNKIKSLGVTIALDDFGTGYSSLSYLTSIPLDTLKIDKSFVEDLDKNKNRILIKNILNLAKDMKLNVVVEGIETEEQLLLISEYNVKCYQGYLFSAPLPFNQAFKFLNKN